LLCEGGLFEGVGDAVAVGCGFVADPEPLAGAPPWAAGAAVATLSGRATDSAVRPSAAARRLASVASWVRARRTAGPSTEPGFDPAVRPASRALPPSVVACRAAPGALSEVGGASLPSPGRGTCVTIAIATAAPTRTRQAQRPRAPHCRTVTRLPDSSVNTGVFARSVSTRGLHSGQGATTHDLGPDEDKSSRPTGKAKRPRGGPSRSRPAWHAAPGRCRSAGPPGRR